MPLYYEYQRRNDYWPAEVTNLPEMHEPFLQMIKELYERSGSCSAKCTVPWMDVAS